MPCWGPARITAIINNITTASIWVWICLFHCFCDFAVVKHFAPIRFYKQTTLRTETFTQSSFYAQILLHRGCAQANLYTQTPLNFTHRLLRKEVFTHRRFYTPMLCTKMFLHALRKAHRRFYTQNLFYTEKPLCRTVFTQRNFSAGKLWHRKTCPHRLHKEHKATFYTERLCFPFLITYLSCSLSQVEWVDKQISK